MSFAYLPLFTGDYRKDTMHLTPMKHGTYLLLLMHCWDTKGPAPLEEQECAGIVNARSADEIDSLRYVLGKYFTRCEDGYYNERMQKEIERSENISRARSEAGRAGYEAKAKQLPKKGRKPQAIAEQVPLSSSSNHTRPVKALKHSPGFTAFWSAYPHCPQRSSKAISWDRWVSMKLEPIASDVMRALQACLDIPQWTRDGRAFVGAAEVWLRKRLWEQDLVTVNDRFMQEIASDPRFADMPR